MTTLEDDEPPPEPDAPSSKLADWAFDLHTSGGAHGAAVLKCAR